ncbi:MAG TPA: GNAT family N-acetyltransferase [Gemmatimonadaceae bacterium]|nr:GNAT family N-acetyltransferase [Gemmatimonadaceae bacterium]
MTIDIRLATAADGAALAAIYAPAVEGQATSFELEPPDPLEMGRRVVAVTARTPWLVCVHRGGTIGYAYAILHRDRPAYAWSVEVSAYVDATSHRAGVGTALYNSLFAVLSLQGFRSAYAGITLPNPASVRLHETVGFRPVGVYHDIGYKLGRWHDVAWFERALGPHEAEPRPPRPLPEIGVDTPAFTAALATGLQWVRLN